FLVVPEAIGRARREEEAHHADLAGKVQPLHVSAAPLGEREPLHPIRPAIVRQLLILQIDRRFRTVADRADSALLHRPHAVTDAREDHAAHQKRDERYDKSRPIHCKSPLVRCRLIHTARLNAVTANNKVTSQLIVKLGTQAPEYSAAGASSRRTPPTA